MACAIRVGLSHASPPPLLADARGPAYGQRTRGCIEVRRRAFHSRRTFFHVALLVLVALLLQQVAMAGYACPLIEPPAQPQVLMADCDGMQMDQSEVLCDKHCNPDNSTSPDLKVASVPPLALPPARFDFAQSLLPMPSARRYADVRPCQSDPPPLLRFCSLQI